jgi:hypothetical protein
VVIIISKSYAFLTAKVVAKMKISHSFSNLTLKKITITMTMTYIDAEYQDNQITVKTAYWQLQLADSQANRKILMVILRGLKFPGTDKHVFTFKEIADALINYRDRRNVNNYWREFEQCEKNIPDYIHRKRKVDQKVIQAVQAELKQNIQAPLAELCEKTNERLGRSDLTSANIRTALEQIPCTVIRKRNAC